MVSARKIFATATNGMRHSGARSLNLPAMIDRMRVELRINRAHSVTVARLEKGGMNPKHRFARS